MDTEEKISVALIAFGGQKLFYKSSEKKLGAVKILFEPTKYGIFKNMVDQFTMKDTISEENVSYLHRYSNNLLTVSELKEIDMPATQETADFLFNRYVECC